MSHPVTVKERQGGIYTQDVHAGPHHFYADEPESYGSADLGPAPYDLLCAALGACTSITLRMYTQRKGWAVEHISVTVTHAKLKQEDGSMRDQFTRSLDIKGTLDDAQRERMVQIADKCPVHKTLHSGSHIITKLSTDI